MLQIAGLAILGTQLLALAFVRRTPQVLLPALVVVVPTLLSVLVSVFLKPILVPRYLAFAVPSFWLMAAYGLQRLHVAARLILLGLIAAAVSVNFQLLYAGGMDDRADIRGATDLILAQAQPGDLVVNASPFADVPFAYYNAGRVDSILVWEETPVDETHVGLADAVSGRARFWYVRDFGAFNPYDEEDKEKQVNELLRNWTTLAQYRVKGAFVFLVNGSPTQRVPSANRLDTLSQGG